MISDAGTGWDELAHKLSVIEEGVSIFVVSGDLDLMSEIVAQDMHHYSQVVLKDVFNSVGVNAARSSFVLEAVKSLYSARLNDTSVSRLPS